MNLWRTMLPTALAILVAAPFAAAQTPLPVVGEAPVSLTSEPGLHNVTLHVDEILISFDSNGSAYVANPAYDVLGDAGFQITVINIPLGENVRTIAMYADGVLEEVAPLDELDPGLEVPEELEGIGDDLPYVTFDKVFLMPYVEYTLALLNASMVPSYVSAPLSLLTSNPIVAGYTPIDPTLENQVQEILQPYLNEGEDITAFVQAGLVARVYEMSPTLVQAFVDSVRQNASTSCYGTPYTWATRTGEPYKVDTFGNTYSVNHGRLMAEGWTSKWDYGYSAGGCSYTIKTNMRFGWANDFAGKSDIVGTGIVGYTYSIDYRGGGNSFTRQCQGGTCQDVGYKIGLKDAEVFLKTPTAASPSYRGVSNMNIPGSTTTTIPPYVKQAIEILAPLVSGGWGSVIASVLSFVVPDSYTTQNWNSVTSNAVGTPGGGVRVTQQVFGNQKIVAGQTDWWYGARGTFNYQWQNTIREDSMFHPCFNCNWREHHMIYYSNVGHVAKVR